MSFQAIFDTIHPQEVTSRIYGASARDVERALAARHRTIDDFAALISPAALPYLEQMAQLSQRITQRRFGKTISMYVPLYLSNECQNICTYCGFSFTNKIERVTLNASISLDADTSELKPQNPNPRGYHEPDSSQDPLDEIIAAFNQTYFGQWDATPEEQRIKLLNLAQHVTDNPDYQTQVVNNPDPPK